METLNRKPFQGTANILRFNWHFYLLALMAVCLLFLIQQAFRLHLFIALAGLFLLLPLLLSLLVSFYVYDASGLYKLQWLRLSLSANARVVNIHAGFDETSGLLAKHFANANLTVLDFYDPAKHTEVSIKRARMTCAAYPGTKSIATENVPLQPHSIDVVFCIFSAHEIRNSAERAFFFQQLRTALKSDGKIIVVEHLRDAANFFAYTVGAFHFHSPKEWKRTFQSAGLCTEREQKINPFVTAYYLQKNGDAS